MKIPAQSKSPRTSRFFLGVGVLCLSGWLHAQPVVEEDEETPVERRVAVEDEVVQLSVFTVESTKGQGYGASNLASATRLNTPAENVPQSISVVNANLLKDIAAYSFEQSVRYIPGVTARQNAPNASIVRGFIVANRYRNSFLMPQYETDTANIDRIEVIKGPSASIAGSSESGGLVNFITKRPEFETSQNVTATIGSYGFMRGVVDATGPLAGRDDLAFRLIAAGTKSDTYRDEDHISKFALYPSLLWNLTPKTQLHVEVEYLQADTPTGFGAVYFAPIEAGAPFSTVPPPAGVTPKVELNRWAPLSLNTSGEPGMTWTHEVSALFATLTHQFNDVLSARAAVSWYDYVSDHYWATVNNTLYFDAQGNLMSSRGMFDQLIEEDGLRLQGDIAYKQQFADNKLGVVFLAGYVVSDITNRNSYAQGALEPINLTNPVYGLPPTAPLTPAADQTTESGSAGLFANTQISAFDDRIILTAGLRRDYNKAGGTVNNFTGARIATARTPTLKSPLIGLTVKPLPNVAVYAVDSEAGAARSTISIYPGIPIDDPRQILATIEPVTSNREYGVKMNFLDGNFSLNLARFEIVQSDFVRPQTDFSAPGGQYRIIDQGTTAKGIEVEWAGDLTRQLLVFGGYARMDTKVPAVRPGGLDGEIRGVPKHKFQLFARYNLQDEKDRGFSLRAGVVHQSAPWGIAQNTYRVPGATRYDLGLDYRLRDWTFSLTVENVTDVVFAQAAIAAGSNTVDAPRAGYFSVARKF